MNSSGHFGLKVSGQMHQKVPVPPRSQGLQHPPGTALTFQHTLAELADCRKRGPLAPAEILPLFAIA